MRKIVIYIFLSVLFVSCKSVTNQEDMVNKVFTYHLGVVENFVNTGYIDNDSSLRRSYKFLENLTKLKGDVQEQFELFYTPSIKNLKDWKKWFKKNKHKLYWDESDQEVRLRSEYLT